MGTINIRIRVDEDLKHKAEALFSELGLDLSTAVNIFLRYAVRHGGIPFDLRMEKPNNETLSAIDDVNNSRTTIILQSIYPITHEYKHWGSITNVMITEGNSWILRIAEDTGCSYLDTLFVLLDDEGNAKDEFMRNDGLHPNDDGLALILDYIRTHRYISSP